MRTVWAIAITAMVVVAAEAHADTVYLKDGQSIWGTEIVEEGDALVIVRPGETLRIPKGDADRVERTRVSIPRYYEAPTAPVSVPSGGSPSPTQPATAPTPSATPTTGGAPSGQEAGTVRPPVIQPPAVPVPAQPTPTLLPPPPPPGADRPR